MPLTCQGQNWQGGLALTLVDSLDTLALMNRCRGCLGLCRGWLAGRVALMHLDSLVLLACGWMYLGDHRVGILSLLFHALPSTPSLNLV
jgi:hypothetical protein